MPRAQVVALEYQGGYRVDATTTAAETLCDYLLLTRAQKVPAAPWLFVARERRNRGDDDVTDIYRRASPAGRRSRARS